LNSINFNKAETKLTSAGHHNTAAYAALSAGAGAAPCPSHTAGHPAPLASLLKSQGYSNIGFFPWLVG
jgi:hypothetical protein